MEIGDKFRCELLSACKSRDEISEIQAGVQDHTDGGGRACGKNSKINEFYQV